MIPLPPLVTYYNRYKDDITLDNNNDLYVASSSKGFLIILLFSGGDQHMKSYTFKRI